MATYDEHRDVLRGKVTFKGKPDEAHEHALATAYSQSRIPAEHVGLIQHFAFGSPQGGTAAARYMPGDRSMHSARNLPAVMNWGPAAADASKYAIAHETGHAYAHVMQPQQFLSNMQTPQGRGVVEAHADNYAHGALPSLDYESGYERQTKRPQSPAERQYMDVDAYRRARGQGL